MSWWRNSFLFHNLQLSALLLSTTTCTKSILAFSVPVSSLQKTCESQAVKMSSSTTWSSEDADVIKDEFQVWPLDEYNLELLNQVHPKSWSNENESAADNNDDSAVYDLVVIGAGAGGLVSSRQVRTSHDITTPICSMYFK